MSQLQPNGLCQKILVCRRKNPLPEPVENYSWKEEGVMEHNKDHWILPNNPKFMSWIHEKFYEFRLDTEEADASKKKSTTKDLFLYQRFIQNYISPKSPYRGILVYHKLGSGKTRTAIATAEPFRKAGFKIVVLLPASLKNNFIDEIKCWGNTDVALPENFSQLEPEEQSQIDRNRTIKIKEQYRFISYNANNTLKELSAVDFKDSVIIIDEVHNLLNMMTSSQSKQGREIYKILMNTRNCRVIALSGTPLLNFSFELGLLFNILRGYMNQNITLFPEDESEFEQYFVDYVTEEAKNQELFKRRIVGLVSYYCGIQEELYPELIQHEPEKIPMSSGQFSQYWQVRQEELSTEARRPMKTPLVNFGANKLSKGNQQKSKKFMVSNTFRPNSRQACNFGFPEDIVRPKSLSKMTKDILSKMKLSLDSSCWTQDQISEINTLFHNDWEAHNEFLQEWGTFASKKEALSYLITVIEARNYVGQFTAITSRAEETLVLAPETQDIGTKRALRELSVCQHTVLHWDNLAKCSPKMKRILTNIETAPGKEGKKFIFSNFRTLEGVEIMARVLQVRGYELFNPNATNQSTPRLRYAIVSGTESTEIRKNILARFNADDNMHGEHLMVLLGTSAVAEGISLKHVRQIHIMEPWWNEVRLQQVIGRGRRIGSHLQLPESERNVHVFQYLSVLSPHQQKVLRGTPKELETTDEHIFNKARAKARINVQFSHILMEAAVDYVLNAAHNQNLRQGIHPMVIPQSIKYMYIPLIQNEPLLKLRGTSSKRIEPHQFLAESEETLKFAPLHIPKIKSLYDKAQKPKYVVLLDREDKYAQCYISKHNDPSKIKYPAYALYDRIAAETSYEFLLQGFLVQKFGLVNKNDFYEVK